MILGIQRKKWPEGMVGPWWTCDADHHRPTYNNKVFVGTIINCVTVYFINAYN